ncbi:MAG: ArnT family glycosyltransferase [Fimbriimonas sp.]
METERPNRSPALYLAGLAMLLLIWGLVSIAKGSEYLTTRHTVDDVFYYLNTAWNHVRLGYPTFDGMHPTNGFHPLWYLLMLGLAQVAPSRDWLLQASILFSILLGAGGLGFILSIGKRLGNQTFVYTAGAIWTAYVMATTMVTTGMENALTAFAFWWCLAALIGWWKTERRTMADAFKLGCPVLVLLWSRIDTLPFAIGLLSAAVLLLPREERTRSNRILAASFLFVLIGFIPYFLILHSWGGTYLPISGLIKSSAGPPRSPGELILRLKVIIKSIGFTFTLGRVVTLALFGVGFISFLKARSQPEGRFLLKNVCLPLLLGVVLHSLYVLTVHVTSPKWYFSPTNISVFFIISLCIALAFEEKQVRRYVLAGCGTLLCFGLIMGYKRLNQPFNGFGNYRYQVALWVKENLPKDAIIASWNAGQIGYFSDHRTINLDGFINSRQYKEEVLSGKKPLSTYIKENNISYVVDYLDYTKDKVLSGRPVLKSIKMKGKGIYKDLVVWDVSGADETWSGGFMR